jgi:hypothetical protein
MFLPKEQLEGNASPPPKRERSPKQRPASRHEKGDNRQPETGNRPDTSSVNAYHDQEVFLSTPDPSTASNQTLMIDEMRVIRIPIKASAIHTTTVRDQYKLV